MPGIDWNSLLNAWSTDIKKSELGTLLKAMADESWLGSDGATETELNTLEDRIGAKMPPSYRSFLRQSNGWQLVSSFVKRLRPASEVDWFHVENEQWATVYSESGSELPDSEYFAYGPDGAPDYRADHMKSLLQISDVEDGVYLLNPKAVTKDGEWEAWFFANWIPGAMRFASFAHLIFYEYQSLVRLHKLGKLSRQLPNLTLPACDAPRRAVKLVSKHANPKRTLEQLIDSLGSQDLKVRKSVVREFAGKLKGRPNSIRRPDLVAKLCEIFYGSKDGDVRSLCVSALTEFADDDAPRPLFDALLDDDLSIKAAGIYALHYFPNSNAIDPLCAFIDSRVNPLLAENAISQLGVMGDSRAVPTLAAVLLDTGNKLEQSFSSAASALARCGKTGVDALLAAATHSDPRVRRAVVVGLDLSGDPRAEVYLERLTEDQDEGVRARAKQRVGEYHRWLMNGGK